MRHGRRNTSGELFYERDTGNNAWIFRANLGAHVKSNLRPLIRQRRYHAGESTRIPMQRRDSTVYKCLSLQALE
jgi:hypothetical protein